ncbi:MAG: transposase [Candidatus Omnitrophota bacterium]
MRLLIAEGREAVMARIARVIAAGLPHHITQRGNRRQQVFFSDDDKRSYLRHLLLYAKAAGIRFWVYCLMDNHVHIIAVPETKDSFARGFSEAHRRYTRMVNFREGWRGYLWEGRFKSCPLSESHLYAAIRYVERNPVRAGIVRDAWDYPWSSARAHAFKQKDPLLEDNFVVSEISDWKAFLSQKDKQGDVNRLRAYANSGRPLGDDGFIAMLETATGRALHKQRPGPKAVIK